MKILVVMALISGMALGQSPELDKATKLKLGQLLSAAQMEESAYWFAMYWSERYKTAERLPQKEWEEFQKKEAPRTLGDKDETYSAHWAHIAAEHRAAKDKADKELQALVHAACPNSIGVTQNHDGEFECWDTRQIGKDSK